MAKLYVIRNNQQHYLAKDHSWVDGSEPHLLLSTRQHDTALNELFEATLLDPALRAEVLGLAPDNDKQPAPPVLNPIETVLNPIETVLNPNEAVLNPNEAVLNPNETDPMQADGSRGDGDLSVKDPRERLLAV